MLKSRRTLTPAFSLCADDCLATLSELILRHQTLDPAWKPKNNIEYIPEFEKSFRHPRNWGAARCLRLCGDSVAAGFRPRSCPGKIGRLAGRLGKSARRRAQINLYYCFPEKSDAEREAIIDEMYTTAPQAMAMMAELALKGPEKIVDRVDWKGLDIIEEMRRNDEKVIFLVPHGWGVDIPAMLMASQGQKMAAMFHNGAIKSSILSGIRCVVVLADACMRATMALSRSFSRYAGTGATICRIRTTVPSTASLSISLRPIKRRSCDWPPDESVSCPRDPAIPGL